jgi:hypothetical protein
MMMMVQKTSADLVTLRLEPLLLLPLLMLLLLVVPLVGCK